MQISRPHYRLYGGRSGNQHFDRRFRYTFFFDIQKSIVFLYIGNEKDEKEIKKTILLTKAP